MVKVEWHRDDLFLLGGFIVTGMSASLDGIVYFGSEDNHLYAVDVRTGQEKWRFEPTGEMMTSPVMFSSPAVVGGMVYFGSGDGNLSAMQ